MRSIGKILRTVRHLKFIQLRFQAYYRLRSKLIRPQQLAGKPEVPSVHKVVMLDSGIQIPDSYNHDLNKFTFLNLDQQFDRGRIDWNFSGHGKLWTYNLNYFDFINQQNITGEMGLRLMHEFLSGYDQLADGLEPYPISLRGMNWIKFLSDKDCDDTEVNNSLMRQYTILSKSLEYHLLGNHLLENAFALLFAAYYYRHESFYSVAEKLLVQELTEQINEDGGHYERSPMYHQILLYRLLDCLNIIKHNPWKSDALLPFLEEKAVAMLGWLQNVTFSNGDVPMVKDTASGIAPSTRELLSYASSLGLRDIHDTKLADSGYRRFDEKGLEFFFDIGQVEPAYQPGHAHSDELNFLLYAAGEPVIVDTGVSTYEANSERFRERATSSHNCISIDGHSASEVWGAFRVGRRAKVKVLEEKTEQITASHDGYESLGLKVQRSFKRSKQELVIEDVLDLTSDVIPTLNLHFHPKVELDFKENQIFTKNVCIELSGYLDITFEKYKFADGFNRWLEAPLVKLTPGSRSKIVFRNVS